MYLMSPLFCEKRGDTILGRTLYKGGHYLRKYGISYFYKLASQICKIETPFKNATAYLTSPNTMYIVCSTYNSEGA